MVSLSLCLTPCLVYTHAHKHTLWTKGRGWRTSHSGRDSDTLLLILHSEGPFQGSIFWDVVWNFFWVLFLSSPGLWSLPWTVWDVFRKCEC